MTCIPEHVREIMNTLESGGFKAWLVGGCLRDMLLDRTVHDWDVATSARGAEIRSMFPRTVDTGARFGTVTVVTASGPVEVTTLRSDGTYSDGRRPDRVRFVDDLLEDLKRRDFTINAMALTAAGELSDPFDGRGDLERRLIRCVGRPEERFSEDALRMFRALRFSAQLGFDIESLTMAAIGRCAHFCSGLSSERVRDETEKILMSPKPELIGTAVEVGLFSGRIERAVLPYDALCRLNGLPEDRRLRWSAFCALLQRAGLVSSARDFLFTMRLDAKAVRYCGAGVEAALAAPLPEDRTGLKRFLSRIGPDAARCAATADVVLGGGEALDRIEEIISSGECFSITRLAVTGDDLTALGIAPGRQLGGILKALLDHVIEHPEDNVKEILMKRAGR
ncbi:MAG: polynucleotide adenylyltransferase [Clostridiales bacterium]|nr:polynucleotide adenylyltransferase [Clostridiales bacterium]